MISSQLEPIMVSSHFNSFSCSWNQSLILTNSDLLQENGLVFTDEFGTRITPQALYRAFKLAVCELGMPTVRFHDLRHSYAVVSLKSGDDVKTVQENLGHATAAFTLDVYGHVTEKMKKDSADRMQAFIKSVS